MTFYDVVELRETQGVGEGTEKVCEPLIYPHKSCVIITVPTSRPVALCPPSLSHMSGTIEDR